MPENEFSRRVGLVGLGKMGHPMAARLRGAGVALAVFDARADVARAFVAQHGGTAAASLAELARWSDVVITMLPDSAAVQQVLLGAGEPGDDRVLEALPDGAVVIDMGSSAPTATQALGRTLAAHGVAMLDAPVSGGVQRAAAGTLAIMIGGAPAVVDACRPLLRILGRQIFVTGALGSAHAMKALNNLVSAAGLLAAAEAVLIGRSFGLDPTLMIDVLNASTGRNNATENKFKQFILSGDFSSGFALSLMVKDLKTAVDLGRETATNAPFSAACRDVWVQAQAALAPDADHTAVFRWLESRQPVQPAPEED